MTVPVALAVRFPELVASFYRCLSKSASLPSLQYVQSALNNDGHDVSPEQAQLLLDAVDASSRRQSSATTVSECVRRLRTSETKGAAECDTLQSKDVLISDAYMGCAWERDKMRRGQAKWIVPVHCDELNRRRRIVFCHGGGYKRYSADDPVYLAFCSRVASSTGLPVLSIDYRLAPENGAPAALEDAVAAVEWAWVNGPNGAEPATHVILGGDSSGGGLALGSFAASFLGMNLDIDGTDHTRGASCTRGSAAGIKGKHRPPSALWGLSPWADLTCSLPSYTSRAWDEVSGTGDPLYTSSPPIEIEKNIVRTCAA